MMAFVYEYCFGQSLTYPETITLRLLADAVIRSDGIAGVSNPGRPAFRGGFAEFYRITFAYGPSFSAELAGPSWKPSAPKIGVIAQAAWRENTSACRFDARAV
jgi:hypothetical protein